MDCAARTTQQVKECASRLVRLAKGSGITVIIVGHVTKSGAIAGPKVVEHMVDTVLYLEGDRFNSYRYFQVGYSYRSNLNGRAG